ncbi:MAG: hypothetical protein LBP33_09140 [Candidatus Adiutrix sp.]|jgi:ABC-2 type transport system permease protein|nr:hypothetical protein [Candidatus Adiutrix sp.]
MPAWIVLMKPGIIGLRNIIRRPGQGGRTRAIFVALFTLVVWALVFVFAVRVLGNLRGADVIGDLLCRKFLGLLWISGAALLMFSAMISSLSGFFLSKDLDLLMAAPISLESLFWARSGQALLVSAWMPAAFMLPVFLAYGYVFKAPWTYYLAAPLATGPLLAGAGYVSQMLVMALVNVFPARRAREIMGLAAIVGFCGLYIAFRLMRPEELVNPAGFMSAAAYLANLQSPSSILLPTEWAVEAVWPELSGLPGPMSFIWWLALLWSTAAALAVLTSYLAQFLYWPGYNKSLSGSFRRRGSDTVTLALFGRAWRFLTSLMKPARRALVTKDLKTFFRDNAQWSQLLLLAALLVIYLYNFSVLNLGRFPAGAFVLENSFAFLNMALVALVAATLALRFAFPSISGEGFAYWIIKAAPMSLKDFLWIKFWLWLPPIWLISLMLIIFGNRYLDVGPVMNISAVLIIMALTPGLCALAIGLGGRFPRFDAANPAQAPTGYGGLIYMVSSSLSSVAVIGLSSWPVVLFLNMERGSRRWQPGAGALAVAVLLLLAAAAICVLLMLVPMRQGLKALKEGNDEG